MESTISTRSSFGFLALALMCTPSLRADELPPALARIPADAGVFVHVRFPPIWDHPVTKGIRQSLKKEMDKLTEEINEEIGLDLDEVESFTLFIQEIQGPGDEENIVLFVTTKKPYDQKAVLAPAHKKGPPIPDPALHRLNAQTVVHFVSPRTFALVPLDHAKDYLAIKPGAKSGPIAEVIELAASGKHTVVGSLNLDKLPRDVLLSSPPVEYRPYLPLLKSKIIVGHLDAKDELPATITFHSPDEETAQEAEESAKLLIRLFAQMLSDGKAEFEDEPAQPSTKYATIILDQLLESMKTAKVSRRGTQTMISGNLRITPAIGTAFANLVQSARDEANALVSQNHLKQIGLALHNYHDVNGGFPPAAIVDKRGKPLLSWRVAILPYIEQDNVYRAFQQDEPWDSPNNKRLSDLAIRPFYLPGAEPSQRTKTHYRVFVGNGAVFDPVNPVNLNQITAGDGASKTILVVEAEEAVPWAKPDPLEYDPKKPLPKLRFRNGVCHAVMCDGSVRKIKQSTPEKTLRAMITYNGGEAIPKEEE